MADILKTGNYPTGGVDLYKLLEGSGNALGVLVDSVLWYNERNATAKYAFVLEHHLDRDGNADYPISGHKSDYEMAYIGGPGNSTNMYVKVDPVAKAPMEANFAEIQRLNTSLANLLDGSNIGGFEDSAAEFKCGPPE